MFSCNSAPKKPVDLQTRFDLTVPTGSHCDLLISERDCHSVIAGGSKGMGMLGKMVKVKDKSCDLSDSQVSLIRVQRIDTKCDEGMFHCCPVAASLLAAKH